MNSAGTGHSCTRLHSRSLHPRTRDLDGTSCAARSLGSTEPKQPQLLQAHV